MFAGKCTFFFIVINVVLLISSKNVTLSDIYGKIVKAVSSKTAKKSQKLLDTHFFTKNKSKAIWGLALKDTWRYLHFNFNRADHVLWEKDVIRMAKLWKGCTIVQNDRTDCREEIFQRLHKYMKDFQWVEDEERRFYASVRTAYQAMELLMLKVLAEKPFVETRKDIVDWYDAIEEEFLESMKYFADFQIKIGCERTFDLSPVQVCQKKEVLWQEFEQPGCETRWKKNLDKDKTAAVTRDKGEGLNVSGDAGDNESGDDESGDDENEDEENEEESEDEKFYKTFKPDFSKIQKIGGSTNDFTTIMEAKFTDFGGKKSTVIARKTADLHKIPKGEVIEELINTAYDKREVYEKKVMKDIQSETQRTFGKLHKAAGIFEKQLKQYLKNSRLRTV